MPGEYEFEVKVIVDLFGVDLTKLVLQFPKVFLAEFFVSVDHERPWAWDLECTCACVHSEVRFRMLGTISGDSPFLERYSSWTSAFQLLWLSSLSSLTPRPGQGMWFLLPLVSSSS